MFCKPAMNIIRRPLLLCHSWSARWSSREIGDRLSRKGKGSMGREYRGEAWIYGVQSVRAVLERRPDEVSELLIAVEGARPEKGVSGPRLQVAGLEEKIAAKAAPTRMHAAKLEMVEKAKALGIK